MLNILKSKIIIGFAVFGALFSFLLAIFAGVSLFWLIVRIFAGGILMGSIGFGLDFFLRQSLSDDDYKSLFRKAAADNDPLGSMNKVDITADAGLAPEEEYKAMFQNNGSETGTENADAGLTAEPGTVSAPSTDETFQKTGPAGEYPDSYNPPSDFSAAGGNAGSQSGGISKKFQEDDLDSMPRVNANKAAPTGDLDNDIKNVEALGRDMKVKQAFAANPNLDGSVKFNMGNKKVTADPKVIAKAIRTVLQRDK